MALSDLYEDLYPDPTAPARVLDPRTAAARRRAQMLRAATAATAPVPPPDAELPPFAEAVAQAEDEAAITGAVERQPQQGFDPNVSAVLGAGEEDPATAARLARAKMLMGTDAPQGRQVGQVFVASSPMEMFSSAAGRSIGALMQKQAAKKDPARQRGAEAAYGLPPDQQIEALLMSSDPGLRQAGTILAQTRSAQEAARLRAAAAGAKDAATAAREAARLKAQAERQAAAIRAADERARLGRTAAQRRAETMAAAGKPPTAAEQTALQRVGQSTNAFDSAFLAGFPSPEPLKGTAENVGVYLAGRGAPGLVPEGVAARSSAWNDVADAIKRIRTGAAMPNAEEWKLNSELIPLGGEPKWLQMDKVHRMIKHLESGLDGARTPEAEAARQRLAELDAQLPVNEAEYDLFNAQATRLRAARGGGTPRPGYGAAGTAPTGAAGAIPQIKSDAEYNALPVGAQYKDPQGNIRTKR